MAELNRLKEKGQTSILTGNSADLNSDESYSPGTPDAQSNAPSDAKVNNKIQNSKSLAENNASPKSEENKLKTEGVPNERFFKCKSERMNYLDPVLNHPAVT